MKKQKPYKVGLVFWTGWVVLTPLRFLLCLVDFFDCALSPTRFYGLRNNPTPLERDQAKWN